MKPMQWSSKIMEWIFGSEDAFPTFISITKELGKWSLPYGQFPYY